MYNHNLPTYQTVSELAIMMGLKRKAVGETVKENKADELSSMFNMILDEKKKNMGKLLSYLFHFSVCTRFQETPRHYSYLLCNFFPERTNFRP